MSKTVLEKAFHWKRNKTFKRQKKLNLTMFTVGDLKVKPYILHFVYYGARKNSIKIADLNMYY